MKIKLILILTIASFAVIFFACKKSTKQEFSIAYPVSGKYWVTQQNGDSSITGPYYLYIYNTAKNIADSIWIDNMYDLGIKFRAFRNVNTFSATLAADSSHTVGFVTLTNGILSDDNINIEFKATLYGADSLGHPDLNNIQDIITVKGRKATGFE